jgi:SAM-dependent methyltransferase
VSGKIVSRSQLVDDAFNDEEQQQIRDVVKDKYLKVSQSAEGLFRYQTGKSGAVALGYDVAILDEIPEGALNSFCGVGNPFSVEVIKEQSSVLDIGCGAGFDLLVASRMVGHGGRVCGIDLTEEMVGKAQALISEFGNQTITVQKVSGELLPFDQDSFDYVISNGVFNLSPCKLKLFREIRRVLRPGGYLQFADIVLTQDPPPGVADSLDDWSQ